MSLQPAEHWSRQLGFRMPAQCAHIQEQLLEGEAVLYHCATGYTHRLNETALAVWRACDGASTTQEVAAGLSLRYSVPVEQALEDVEQLVAALALAGLLEVRE